MGALTQFRPKQSDRWGGATVNIFMQISVLGILLIGSLMHSVQINALQREVKNLKARVRKVDPSSREPVLNI